MSRLRLAVVGTGHLGSRHARIASTLPDARLVAVVDPLLPVRQVTAQQTGARSLADFHELFGLVDAAIVASPTLTHYSIVRELLLGGIHVLVEKPMTATVDEAEELVQLAKRQQLVLQVGHVERFNPAFTALRSRLVDPKFIAARRLSGYKFRSTDIGVVHDLMIHDIDAVLSLVNSPVTAIQAIGISVMGNCEDMVDARLHFASGCIAQLTASRVSYENSRQMQVFTDNCCGTIDFGNKRAELVEPTVEILNRQFEVDTLTDEQMARLQDTLFQELLVRSEVPVTDSNALEQEQLDFMRAVRTSSEPMVGGDAGRDALAVAEGILAETRNHNWDGVRGTRLGAMAMPHRDPRPEMVDLWAEEDTVVLRRKAG